MLEIENLHKSFGARAVLSDVNLTVARGATHALIGTSGSGKTTLIRVALGLVPFEKGYVKIGGQALSAFGPAEWAERIGYVPQEGGLFPHLNGRQNATLLAKLRNWSEEKMDARLKELTQLVGLDPALLERFPSEVSGGQRQRVALMRAAFLDPAVMLLDEPMGALDPVVRSSLQAELKEIFKRLGKTVLLVTHDLSEAVYLAEGITLLHEGRVIQTGSFDDLARRPNDSFVTKFVNAHRALPEGKSPS